MEKGWPRFRRVRLLDVERGGCGGGVGGGVGGGEGMSMEMPTVNPRFRMRENSFVLASTPG